MQYFDQYPAVPEGEKETKLGEEPYIHPSCRIRDSKIGAWTALGANTFLVESSFGDYSYTAGNVQIIYSEVGKYCSIANSVRINPGNHPQWRVTQHHMTYRRKHYGLGAEDDGEFFQWRRDHRCVIGHDVWIGHGAVIMPGVEIGTGAVIGSGAVVTKNIGPYEVAVGVAAKVIKKRFDDATIEKLLASEWWNWDRPTLEARFDELLDLGKFLASPFSKPGLSSKPDPNLKQDLSSKPESTSKPDPTLKPESTSKQNLSSKPGSSISPASKPSGSSASKPSGPVNDDGSPDTPLKDIATV